MFIQMGEGNATVQEIEPGAVFMFGGNVYMMTNDKKNNRAVNLEDGQMHYFAPSCKVQEVEAIVHLSGV